MVKNRKDGRTVSKMKHRRPSVNYAIELVTDILIISEDDHLKKLKQKTIQSRRQPKRGISYKTEMGYYHERVILRDMTMHFRVIGFCKGYQLFAPFFFVLNCCVIN